MWHIGSRAAHTQATNHYTTQTYTVISGCGILYGTRYEAHSYSSTYDSCRKMCASKPFQPYKNAPNKANKNKNKKAPRGINHPQDLVDKTPRPPAGNASQQTEHNTTVFLPCASRSFTPFRCYFILLYFMTFKLVVLATTPVCFPPIPRPPAPLSEAIKKATLRRSVPPFGMPYVAPTSTIVS